MTLQSVTVQLPTGLYNRLKRQAEQAHRSVEAEVVEAVAGALPADEGLSPELNQAMARLAGADDEMLWQMVKTQFPKERSVQLESLHLRRQAGAGSEADERQAAELATEVEQFMFLRAHAMSLLMQRGYDVSTLAAT